MDCDFVDGEFIYGKNIEQIKRKKELILDSLRNVIDPDLKKDIVELNFVRNLQIVEKENKKCDIEFDLNLTTPACPVKEQLVEECKKNINTFDWVGSINIHETFASYNGYGKNEGNTKKEGYNQIENIILIYSCKGGVGKSFLSVNFSFYLKKKGASVGILDADINGPSLSTLLPFDFEYAKFEQMEKNEREQRREKQKTEKIFFESDRIISDKKKETGTYKEYDTTNAKKDFFPFNKEKEHVDHVNERENEALIEPLIFKDVKLMSYAYIKNKHNLGFALFRGAILNELIDEFINHVHWGTLNYLIIDMPPGTSDMHLNLMEGNNLIDGAVIVTTPNELAINDVQKSINMCNYFNIPIISLIVNMSYFICDNCDKKHYIFNSVGDRDMTERNRTDSTHRIQVNGTEKDKSNCTSSRSSSSNSSSISKDEQLEREEGGKSLKRLKDQVSKVLEIPFHPLFAKNVYYVNGEKRFPFMLAYNDHFLIKHLESVFENIVREISILKNNDKFVLPSLQVYKKYFMQLSFDTVKNQFVFSEDILICHIKNIRIKCKCEICKLKKKKILNKKSLWNPSIYVKEIKQLGVYNVKIIWSDNHISVYSYSYLKHLFLKSTQRRGKKTLCHDTTWDYYDW